MCPAVSAARGSSIIVPIVASSSTPSRAASSASTAGGLLGHQAQLAHGADQRDHDLRAARRARAGGPRRRPGRSPGPACRTAPGRRCPAAPRAARASGSPRAAGAPPRAASRPCRWARRGRAARATRTDSSVRSGRNSCSGGSSSRIVTGLPAIAREDLDEVAPLQRQQLGQGRPRAPRRSSASTSRSTVARRSPRNMCSVRHSPMPCGAEPARPRRVLAGVGVGPHQQPPPRVGVADEPVHRAHQVARVRGRRVRRALEVLDHRRRRRPAPRRGTPRRCCRRSTACRPR